MKPVHVLVLAIVAGGAAVAVWSGFGTRSNSAEFAQEKLFPNLAANLDSVSRLSVSNAQGAKVTIERKDGIWVVKEKFSYPADGPKVNELVLALSDARLVEQKTANLELYSRIGLRGLDDPESAATLLSLTTPAGELKLLAGNQSERFGGSTFARKPDSASSFLVTPALSAPTDVNSWIDSSVFDIAADQIQSVTVASEGVEVAKLEKPAMFDAPFDLAGRADAQALNDTAVRNLSQGLTGLEFERVIRGVAFAVNDYKSLNVTYTLFSGVLVDVTLFYKDATNEESNGPAQTKFWLNAGARFDDSLAQRFVPQPSGDSATVGETIALTTADLADRRAEVERINQTRKRWIYQISQSQFERFNQSAESLVSQN